jgi:hypothetical protein
MHRIVTPLCLLAVSLCLAAPGAAMGGEDGWISLFDGRSMDGWKVTTENPDTWKVEDGALVCHGPRSHLFYVGDAAPFQNFHFKAEVMTTPGSNSGIYFHTKYQQSGWPQQGYEAQVNITHKDPKKSGSLYGVVNVADPPAKDNEWHTQEIIVNGKQVVIKINGKTLVDYTEPADKKPGDRFRQVPEGGTFALQGHDPGSKVLFRNIRVKKLP